MTIIEQWLEHLPVPFVHQAGAVPFGSFRCQGTRLEGNRSPLVAEWFLQAWSALVTFQDMPSFMHFESFWHMFCHSLMHWHCRFETWKIDYGENQKPRDLAIDIMDLPVCQGDGVDRTSVRLGGLVLCTSESCRPCTPWQLDWGRPLWMHLQSSRHLTTSQDTQSHSDYLWLISNSKQLHL